MTYCVGLIGSIASGKSTAADFFKTQGIDVLSADTFAKSLTQKDQPAFIEILNHFGNQTLKPNGDLDRRYLRQLISQDSQARQWLEGCLHPKIRTAIEKAVRTTQTPYCVIEIPLLLNRADYPWLNRILYIETSQDRQIERIMTRDECSKEDALSILKIQPDQSIQKNIADDHIINDGTHEDFLNKLSKLHDQYQIFRKLT